jgi:hypothetical protein
MCAAGTFLGEMEVLVIVDNLVRTTMYTIPAAGAFLGVNDNQSIVAAVDSPCNRARSHTRGISAMHAHYRLIDYPYLGDSPSFLVVYLHPELAGVRLRLGIGCPIIPTMFVFTGYLAIITADAL